MKAAPSARQQQQNAQDWSWHFWYLVPLYPYSKRRTLRQEILKDTIWTFDQIQGIFYTVVPIRMSVIRLACGGLLIYAPIAPTRECIRGVNELVAVYGEVKYIILPTASGLEHKVFVGPFAKYFPSAEVFIAPSQWSYPFNLPLSWLGFPNQRTRTLPDDSKLVPFTSEFEYKILDINLGRGSFVEVALWHKPSRTVLLTDTILAIPETPPSIVQLDPYPLLFHARDNALEEIRDTPENRRKGWQRISLFALYFRPGALKTVGLRQALTELIKAPDKSKRAYFGLYPFRWENGWQDSFEALRGNGRPMVAPILQTLILDHAPTKTLEWASQVASWDFERIISCHFEASIYANPNQFRQAFAFLEPETSVSQQSLPAEDLAFILKLEENLDKKGITRPPQPKSVF